MKKYVLICITLMVLILSITACGRKDTQDIVSEVLSLDASGGSEVSNYDTHSGNGDGTSCIVLSFKADGVLKEIQENTEWKAFLPDGYVRRDFDENPGKSFFDRNLSPPDFEYRNSHGYVSDGKQCMEGSNGQAVCIVSADGSSSASFRGGGCAALALIAYRRNQADQLRQSWKLLKFWSIPFYVLNFLYSLLIWFVLIVGSHGIMVFLITIPIMLNCILVIPSGCVGTSYIMLLRKN